MDALHKDILSRVEIMSLFTRNGRLYYGDWLKWRKSPIEQRAEILKRFQDQKVMG